MIDETGRSTTMVPIPSADVRDIDPRTAQHGGDVVDRAAKGERLTITRSGKPVAELRPLSREQLSLDVITSHRRRLPPVDLDDLLHDLDQILER